MPVYKDEKTNLKDRVGVVTGLAWTAVGGVTLEIEMHRNGKIISKCVWLAIWICPLENL